MLLRLFFFFVSEFYDLKQLPSTVVSWIRDEKALWERQRWSSPEKPVGLRHVCHYVLSCLRELKYMHKFEWETFEKHYFGDNGDADGAELNSSKKMTVLHTGILRSITKHFPLIMCERAYCHDNLSFIEYSSWWNGGPANNAFDHFELRLLIFTGTVAHIEDYSRHYAPLFALVNWRPQTHQPDEYFDRCLSGGTQLARLATCNEHNRLPRVRSLKECFGARKLSRAVVT